MRKWIGKMGSDKRKPGVRTVLAAHSQRKRSSANTMRALGIDWKGDLVRTLNANHLPVPLGDVETKPETVEYVSDLIAQEIERTGGAAFRL